MWQRDLGIEIEEEKWKKMFQNIFYITNNVTLRYFHYKILNRVLKTNWHLAKWDKQINEKCTYCRQNVETVIHLFYECPKVEKMWKTLQKWIKYFMNVNINITKEIIFLNNYSGKNKQPVNTLILISKRFIYVKKFTEKQLSFCTLLAEINHIRKIERITAYQNNRMKKHQQKWGRYP